MDTVTVKVCRVCNKDVSNTKRVKDAAGKYYCQACHDAAQKAAATKAAPPPPPADDGTIGFAEPDPPRHQPIARAKPAEGEGAAKPAPAKLPEFCPNCGAKVFANRKFCIKCNRDVTQLGNIAALRAKREAEAKKGAGDLVIAVWVGRAARVAIGIVVIAVLAFIGYGVYLQFAPISVYDHYPKTREGVVRDFLKHISDGTEKDYDKAYALISFRERTFGDDGEASRFKATFHHIHDDFAQKYGADWLSKMKLENTGINKAYQDDEVDFKMTLGEDKYTIATQAQIDETTAVSNMVLPRKNKPLYNEDGKLRFGILDVEAYPVNKERRMAAKYGNQVPPSPDDMFPGGGMVPIGGNH